MKIDFDPGKDAINTRKHGVSLADAALLEWECMWLIEDVRNCYGERRMIGYAPIGSRVYMQIKSKFGRVFDLPSDQEEAEINAGIDADPDARELTEKEFEQLRPMGRPKAEVTKERITIRLSPEVVAKFRATGSGWQTRMDKALQEYLSNHNQSDIERLG
ncbi:BrnA antitoxin family protein [Marinobacter sp. LV10R510-11A]|uniref:BrnA antitoxin family protein n=1 Tax=Marinobacter sp. LV10R510-11A TaxID=1415568 RepID=UPI000BB680F5|nr:BrnA antitoxin family protein [Marinobacter sp. LV10R510-11A]